MNIPALDQIVRMRSNYLQPGVTSTKLVDEDSRHSLPISQMGNYQDYLKNAQVPLREIESTPVRQHMFGNPFKINKNMIMDEVVMDEIVPNRYVTATLRIFSFFFQKVFLWQLHVFWTQF